MLSASAMLAAPSVAETPGGAPAQPDGCREAATAELALLPFSAAAAAFASGRVEQ